MDFHAFRLAARTFFADDADDSSDVEENADTSRLSVRQPFSLSRLSKLFSGAKAKSRDRRSFPRAAFAALAKMLGWSKLETTSRAAMHENIQNLQRFRA
jgi:hypothetical protein